MVQKYKSATFNKTPSNSPANPQLPTWFVIQKYSTYTLLSNTATDLTSVLTFQSLAVDCTAYFLQATHAHFF